jgi:hypothetical protein
MPAFVRRPDIAADTADAICSLAGEIPGFVHRIAGRRDPGSHLDALAGSDDVASDHRTCLSGAMLARVQERVLPHPAPIKPWVAVRSLERIQDRHVEAGELTHIAR